MYQIENGRKPPCIDIHICTINIDKLYGALRKESNLHNLPRTQKQLRLLALTWTGLGIEVPQVCRKFGWLQIHYNLLLHAALRSSNIAWHHLTPPASKAFFEKHCVFSRTTFGETKHNSKYLLSMDTGALAHSAFGPCGAFSSSWTPAIDTHLSSSSSDRWMKRQLVVRPNWPNNSVC